MTRWPLVPWLLILFACLPARRGAAYEGGSAVYVFLMQRSICGEDERDNPVDWQCAGAIRGRPMVLATLQRELQSASISQDPDHKIESALLATTIFRMTEAIPLLRRMTTKWPLPGGDPSEHWERANRRLLAARALFELGEPPRSFAPALWDLLKFLEGHRLGTMFPETLDLLVEADPAAVGQHLQHLLERRGKRLSDFTAGEPLEALPFLARTRHVGALPVLRRLMQAEVNEPGVQSMAYCDVGAARLSLDEDFRRRVRRDHEGDTEGSPTYAWTVTCGAEWLRPALGEDPDDARALSTYTIVDQNTDEGTAIPAYERMLHLLVSMSAREPGAAPAEGRRIAAARRLLREVLAKEVHLPVLSDLSSPHYSPIAAIRHHAALASLGDAAAERWLYTRVDDRADTSGLAWIAAHHALELGLPGALPRALALLQAGLGYVNSEQQNAFSHIRHKLLDLVVRRVPSGDARWTVSLLDADVRVRERALFHLSRLRPAGACEVVARAAKDAADDQAADHAFYALSVLGEVCRPTFVRLLQPGAGPAPVRGMALEMLAALGGADVPAAIERLSREGDDLALSARRARRIYALSR